MKSRMARLLRFFTQPNRILFVLLIMLCSCHSGLGPYKETIVANEKAVQKNPDDAEAYEKLGTSYMKLGRFKEALEAFISQAYIEPEKAETYYKIGICYDQIGRYKDAFDQYQVLLKLDKTLADELLAIITN
jgi:tetratricopeptide (TPR) repeat protein